MSDKTETILDFDFGFTAMTEDELTVVQDSRTVAETASATAQSEAEKAQLLYNAITPLLNNLKANRNGTHLLKAVAHAGARAYSLTSARKPLPNALSACGTVGTA